MHLIWSVRLSVDVYRRMCWTSKHEWVRFWSTLDILKTFQSSSRKCVLSVTKIWTFLHHLVIMLHHDSPCICYQSITLLLCTSQNNMWFCMLSVFCWLVHQQSTLKISKNTKNIQNFAGIHKRHFLSIVCRKSHMHDKIVLF